MTSTPRAIAGETVAVTDFAGQQPTLVFIHGNSLSTRTWAHQLAASELAAYRRVAFDLPGHGSSQPSPRPDHTYSLPGYVACVKGLVESLGDDRVVLIGHSLGGHIAVEAAAEIANVAGVFVTGMAPLATAEDLGRAFRPVPELQHAFGGELERDQAEAWAAAMTAQPPPPWMVDTMCATDPQARANLGASAAAGRFRDEVAAIGQVSCPVAIVHAADDALIATDYLQSLNLPLWRDGVQMVVGASHSWVWERPDEFNRLLAAFVADVTR